MIASIQKNEMKQNHAVLGSRAQHPSRTMVVTFIQPIPEQKSGTRHYTTLESYFLTQAIFSLQKGKKGVTLNYFLPMFLSWSGIIADIDRFRFYSKEIIKL
ncbi:uncharacterized protein TNIN_268171 [Trichonephila inaurata madagascariensis]|uniref:Uncharacterized protein n=1 Tax=Trichonephila inaurata madagascariensis TaxID=2747483 RepID=A0A8X6XZ92_9ARAC|nr:uncharacterized protein TNIN_32621 [Trichonephila inaurata madagascariensis]GFY70128.1 uncharacterized protein TNIN_268171 [Trichonephila inaurata madagascariensis]